MNTFKKKSLYAALAGVSALGMAGAAQAVNVNPDGLGQVLIYPYYTVRSTAAGNAYNSLLSVVNSTASAKAVKVRFLEGKNSREVLDFNLYLSPRDVWTAAIVPTANAAGITTADVSCTVPKITGTVEFVNYAYASDPAGGSLDRTREGYVEIIEMGDVTGAVAATVTHVNGVPACGAILADDTAVQNSLVLGTGGLFGGIQLVNVNAGSATATDATALEAWRQPPNGPVYGNPSAPAPDLTQAAPAQATVYRAGTATTYSFATGIDAVSAAIMHDSLMNEIIQDTGTRSATDWVVTFPTKRFYVSGATASPPFQRAFASSGACDDIGIAVWDREERTGTSPINFSPPLTIPNTALCWEANVISWFNTGSAPSASLVLGSTNNQNVNTGAVVTGYQNGWARIDLANATSGAISAHRLVALSGATFTGLPVVGFSAFVYNNNVAVPGVRSIYGLSFQHKYTRSVVAP